MTSYWKIYDAFLAKILEDEWGGWEKEQTEADMRQLLESAIPHFKFPRVNLDRGEEGFINELGAEEIQILATYMKCEWLERTILIWENVKPLYEERDFSQANLIDKLRALLELEKLSAAQLEGVYYRSIKGKSYKYSKLAGAGK